MVKAESSYSSVFTLKQILFNFVCVYVHVYGFVHMSVGVHRGQKRALDLPPWVSVSCLMQVLGTKLSPPARVVHVLNKRDIFSVSLYFNYILR